MVENIELKWIDDLMHWGGNKMTTISQTTITNAFPEWNYMNFD